MAIDLVTMNIILRAACTLIILSYVYGENPWYRLGEHIFIGTAAGHAIVMGIKNIQTLAITKIVAGSWWYAIPILMGLLIYTRFSGKYLWLSRYPYAIMIGVAMGLNMAGRFESVWYKQTLATLQLPLTSLDNIYIIVGTCLVALYFVFSKEHTGTYGNTVKLGRWAAMFYFGITFGSVTMARMSVLCWRIYFLTQGSAIYVTIVAIIVAVASLVYIKMRKPAEIVNAPE